MPFADLILERHRPALEATTPSTIIIIISITTNYTINIFAHYRTHGIVRRRMASDARQRQTTTQGHARRARLRLLHRPTRMRMNTRLSRRGGCLQYGKTDPKTADLHSIYTLVTLPCFVFPLLIHSQMTKRFAQPDADRQTFTADRIMENFPIA